MESLTSEKIILIGARNVNWSVDTLRNVYIMLGVAFLALISFAFYTGGGNAHRILYFVWTFQGLYFLYSALILHSKNSPYSPKVKISDKSLALKASVLKKYHTFLWTQIREIEFGLYEIKLRFAGSEFDFHYKSTPENSKIAKEAISKVAESKNIPVIAG